MWLAAQLILTAGLAQALASNWRSIRSDRLNAGLCPDSDDDLCSNGRPDSTRLACKCDYACATFGDCCVDAPRSPQPGADARLAVPPERLLLAQDVSHPLATGRRRASTMRGLGRQGRLRERLRRRRE
ncbi:hypothetical protein MRX96_058135 [Rhipicephalus microplus]